MIPSSNLASLLLQAATRFPDRAGLIRGDEEWSWAQIAARVRAVAGGLRDLGVAKGDRVLVHSRNAPAMFESMWASWMLGAVWVPTNFRLTPMEVAYLAESSQARVHLFDPAFPDHAAAARAANPAMRIDLALDEPWEALARGTAELARPVSVDRDHPCWFFYTSGTTGRPKAAVLTHGQMGFVVTNHLCDLMPGTTEQDVSLVVAPLSHGAGIHALTQVARGAASVLLPGERLDCAEAWRLIECHRVSNMFTVPTILNMLARDEAVDRHDHRSLRYVIYAGAPMYRADQVHALRKLGPVLVQYFGLGEVTGNITVLPPSLHSIADEPGFPIGSCGYARTGMEIAILDAEGRSAAAGETGEICVRGPAVFAGYFNNPEATAKAFAGGWFHTGDLGHLDARGFLYITGRASDMYISGGSNVYPREIEDALLTHPAVAEACVVGMPDARWGESGVAVLVLRGPAAEVDLRTHLAGRLARYKLPARFVFWPEMPKSGYGKIVKRDIKARLETEG
ncbi:MAG: AMP-binding protein [Rhodospirillales bacterium]|nr:AMP-binding protein [Rhodospirillales bacterium]MDE2575665.1 AMP-binding protein [Rhodospirillales bacterium]